MLLKNWFTLQAKYFQYLIFFNIFILLTHNKKSSSDEQLTELYNIIKQEEYKLDSNFHQKKTNSQKMLSSKNENEIINPENLQDNNAKKPSQTSISNINEENKDLSEQVNYQKNENKDNITLYDDENSQSENQNQYQDIENKNVQSSQSDQRYSNNQQIQNKEKEGQIKVKENNKEQILKSVKESLSQADQYIEEIKKKENDDSSKMIEMEKQLEALKTNFNLLKEQNDFLKQQLEEKNQIEKDKQKAIKIMNKANKETDLKKQKKKLKQAEKIISKLKHKIDKKDETRIEAQELLDNAKKESNPDRQSELISQSISIQKGNTQEFEKQKQLKKQASLIAQDLLDKSDNFENQEDKNQILLKAKQLIEDPQSEINLIQNNFEQLKDSELKKIELNLLNKAEQEEDIAKKQKILNSVQELENHPQEVLYSIKEKFLEDQFLENIPDKCKLSVQSALQIKNFDKQALLARIPQKELVKNQVEKILNDNHMNEFIAKFFVKWLTEEVNNNLKNDNKKSKSKFKKKISKKKVKKQKDKKKLKQIEKKNLISKNDEFHPKIKVNKDEKENTTNSISNLVKLISNKLNFNQFQILNFTIICKIAKGQFLKAMLKNFFQRILFYALIKSHKNRKKQKYFNSKIINF